MKNLSSSADESNYKLSYKDTYEEIKNFQRERSISTLSKNKKEFTLSRGVRWFQFSVFILLALVMNMDHGTIPAATDEIRLSLEINDETLGVFGSLVFFGNLIGIFFCLIRFFVAVFINQSLQPEISFDNINFV